MSESVCVCVCVCVCVHFLLVNILQTYVMLVSIIRILLSWAMLHTRTYAHAFTRAHTHTHTHTHTLSLSYVSFIFLLRFYTNLQCKVHKQRPVRNFSLSTFTLLQD